MTKVPKASKAKENTDTAEGIRVMKAALEKPGGKTYHNAVELQLSISRHKDRMKQTIKVVVDNTTSNP
jgi:hypothetical protein